MTELNVLFFALLFKCIAVCVVSLAATYLAFNEKNGWGWLIFLAIVVASTSYKYTPDVPTSNETKERTHDA